MIADRISAIVSSCSSIEKSTFPLVVCLTWRPIEGYEVVLHVDCGMRRRRHRSQVVPGGRTTLNRLRDKMLEWVYTTGASSAPDSSTLSTKHNRHVTHAHGTYTQQITHIYQRVLQRSTGTGVQLCKTKSTQSQTHARDARRITGYSCITYEAGSAAELAPARCWRNTSNMRANSNTTLYSHREVLACGCASTSPHSLREGHGSCYDAGEYCTCRVALYKMHYVHSHTTT